MNPGLDRLYPGDCRAAWPLAKQLLAEEGPRLAAKGLLQEVSQLVGLAAQLARRMTEPNRVCAACGARPDGGCCSLAIADEADALLLLLNLLAGIKLDGVAKSPIYCVAGRFGSFGIPSVWPHSPNTPRALYVGPFA